MHVISYKKIRLFAQEHQLQESDRKAFDTWNAIMAKMRFHHIDQVRAYFPHADSVGACTVFNVAGNTYRIITKIYYDSGVVLIRSVLTHKEYDKNKWKEDCSCD